MPNEAHIGRRTLTFESDFDLMIGDPLSQALNTHAQLFISPHTLPDPTNRTPASAKLSIGQRASKGQLSIQADIAWLRRGP